MSELKPITVYVHSAGPNPFKVTILLEELAVPYTTIVVEDPKEDWFVAINPNGRVPTIEDPNSDIILWESGAIMEYLVETYDVNQRLCGTSTSNIPLAKERYVGEIARVISVLDNILGGKQYLVDGRLTYADLAFVPWNRVVSQHPFFKTSLWEKHAILKQYPSFSAWQERLNDLPSVKAAYK
ncbi:hypothetical protein FAUST_1099 [Fusarium austroamericanum]|uniref:Glutathione S-transferase n=1 Tax=Fusarium austroamericanum TaxID=282268 RepID=A0AAN6C9L2_FUSAU|nr:hypothetical protein FAUST_1099 [Fusarium austroamericanum]